MSQLPANLFVTPSVGSISQTINGRTYSANVGQVLQVPACDAVILTANGWTLCTDTAVISTLPAVLTAVKTTALAITSSTTLTVDPQLIITFNQTGWYAFEFYLCFYGTTTGTQGVQFDLNSGTAILSNMNFAVSGYGTAQFANAGITSAATATTIGTIGTAAATPSWVWVDGSVKITGTGTLGIRLAQGSSSANATNVLAGSNIYASQIG